MKFEDFWYVVALSKQLKSNQVLSRQVLGEWLAIFRTKNGKPVALQDRCTHRNSRLSCGKVQQGYLQCPYHGWVYDESGGVVSIPSEGENFKPRASLKAKQYHTCEQDGFIYVCLTEEIKPQFSPFSMPYYQQPGWHYVRVVHRFNNNVTNCAENFIDIPHTVSVHPGIFRKSYQQKLEMTVTRTQGTVIANYHNEDTNLGWWTRFLNPSHHKIYHSDRFFMPNITSVEYQFAPRRHLFITSQSVPETETSTLVYTDATFSYGIWSYLATPFVWYTAKRIIGQDVKILQIQQEVIEKYGEKFAHTQADTIHVFVESIRKAIAQGKDPRTLPDKTIEVTFWV
ncbi:aromatic ring-hydroxylating dioxygenase subunit alpha [Cyanobacterium aponinum AL20118]|uniref:Aromatic ring-hydroxylating dioxygenase subunit alpha n=1 Tax=Cyanobacterium aponinum AL20115 TaxID=3090662 RepID=A0AAF0ZHA2_9CHRO|nr:aromatic ring-hydroxylating dioxygenase subunit alpha [Cyanobacterium aponinum]MBD2393593.1 aromatic ring-hydroxylating dioxygenase subunit alpha [Cyanobacterium aponinum FACHB-4101]WPF90230.1 aromatic ring-hydroxylating dioxygenase subunit alpha [Cyanobacterium aponinum AL20115]